MGICTDGFFSKRPMLYIRWCAVRPACFNYTLKQMVYYERPRMKSLTLPSDSMYHSDQRARLMVSGVRRAYPLGTQRFLTLIGSLSLHGRSDALPGGFGVLACLLPAVDCQVRVFVWALYLFIRCVSVGTTRECVHVHQGLNWKQELQTQRGSEKLYLCSDMRVPLLWRLDFYMHTQSDRRAYLGNLHRDSWKPKPVN